jgi:adenylate cyclase
MTRPASPAAPQPGAPADARPSWAQPLRVHLGVAMVALLVAVAGTIIAFDYASRRGAAVADATLEMQEFADRLVERYQVLADDPVIFADLAAIADVFLEPPPSGLPAKIAYLRTLTAQAPQVDGAFAGYPDGAAIYLTDLRRSQAWRRALDPPPGAALAVEIVTVAADGGRTAYWEYLDHAGQPIGRPRPRWGMTRGQGPGIAWQRTARSSS